MTVEDLRAKINAVLAVGDFLKTIIPGGVDDRILEYGSAVAESDKLLSLINEDFFGGDELFRGSGQELTLAGSDAEALDPTTIALIIQLVQTFGPVIAEWIRRRRER